MLNLIGGLVSGVLGCFFGLRLKKIVLFLAWFIVGIAIASGILDAFHINNTITLVLELLVGVILGVLSMKLQKFSFFIILFVLGFSIVYFSTPHLWYNYLIGFVVGLILGIVATKTYEPMIILSSSFAGAWSISHTITDYFSLTNWFYYVLILIAAFILGCSFQFKNYKHK